MSLTPRLLRLLGAWVALGVAASVWPALFTAWAAAGGALLALLVLDGLSLSGRPPLVVQRELPRVLPLGRFTPVQLRLENPGRRAVRGELFDHAPPDMEQKQLPQPFALAPAGWLTTGWRVRPLERGERSLGPLELRQLSALGLLTRQHRLGEPTTLRVLPDFRQVSQFALLALDDRVSRIGVHAQRRRGEGTEFFQLREYREGDTPRQVDWKATSRRGQLISREHRDEQDQQVVLMLDCGQRLRSRDGELSHFDEVLNAALLLGYVALRQGDATGLLAFSGQDRWVRPRKGVATLNGLIRAVYHLQPTTAPPDYLEAARRVRAQQRRRALVVLLTNLRGEDEGELLAAVALLRRSHLVMVASLREPQVRLLEEAPVTDLEGALQVAGAAVYSRDRRRSLEVLRRAGVLVVDEEPARLPAALVNRYLDVKRARLL